MASGNTAPRVEQAPESTSGNTAEDKDEEPKTGPPALSVEATAVLARYQRALAAAPLSAGSRAKYVARVRGFLCWLDSSDVHGDPLDDPAARDGAVRDWRAWAKTVARLRPTTINNTLAAVDDFYARRGLGPASARREPLPRHAPKALAHREVLRYLRAVEHCDSTRDTVVALLPFYAGLRVAEVVGLDLADVSLSARKGRLRIRGKGRDGGKLRELPLTRPELRAALAAWLEQRSAWPGAEYTDALLLNRRGGRLSDRAARTIITDLGDQVGLGDGPAGGFGPHVLRHTFATQLLRGGADPVLVAELLGHASLDTVRAYTQPDDIDREHALDLLTTDQ